MRIVVEQLKVFELEIEKIFHFRIDAQDGQRSEVTTELQFCLLYVVAIQVRITKCMDEISGLKTTNLRHHHGQKSVGSDVERNTQKCIGTALIQLTA